MNYRAGGSGRKETDRFSEITDGEWHFITGTFDRDGNMTLYIDGEQPTQGSGYGNGAAQVDISDQQNSIDVADFTIGADGFGNYGLQNGYIDELSVYKEVLTQEEVKALQAESGGQDENVTDEPVLDVSFDSEDAKDSVSGTEGEITGSVEFVDGISGKAVHISNSESVAGENTAAEQYIDFGTPENLQFGTDDFTVMFWYQSDGTLPKEGAVVSNKDWSTGSNPGFAIGDMKNGMTLNFRAQNSSGRLDTSRYGGATEAGVWHHIAAVFNRTGNMTLYVDGEAAASQSISSQAGNSIDVTNFVIGADGKYQCGLQDGYIDELKVYKSALSQEEIRQYNAPYVLANQLAEYEALIASSDAAEAKKETFQNAIDEIRAKAEGVTDPDEIQALQEELRSAYNTFMGPDEGIMSFEVISDAHISGTNNNNSPNRKLIDAMEDISEDYTSDVSAVLNCGDYSNYASEEETKGYFNIIGQFKDQFEILTALGNHDVRWKTGWDEVESRYLNYNQEYMGDTLEGQSYYDKWIDGYHFIVLNTQWDTKDRAYLSPEELNWLDETMAENASSDKPIFVVLHQPLYDTYTNSNAWPDGVQDHQLKEILRKYPQTIMFNGHIHDGIGAVEVVQTDYGTMVDVPGMNSNDYGDSRGQLGFHVTVYGGEVRLDMRDYLNDEWVDGYSYTIKTDGTSYPAGKVMDVSFDDKTAEDSTGNGNDGTIKGNVGFVTGVDGGKAVHIKNSGDGEASQYIDFGNNLNLGEEDLTVMFWYKADSNQTGTVLANKDAGNDSQAGLVFGSSDGTSGIGLTAGIAGGSEVSTSAQTLADGKWHAVAATFDRDGQMVLYIDGQQAESRDISTWAGQSLSEGLNFVVGADASYQNGVSDMYFDNLRVYQTVLGAGEISTTWNPYEITTEDTSITISWTLPENENVEPAKLLLNGEEVQTIASGETSKTITGLEKGKTYTVEVVNHEKSNAGNYRDVHAFVVTTGVQDTEEVLVDFSALETLYTENKEKDISGYTESSQETFKTALAQAEAILDKAEATQDEVDSAVKALQEALDGLKEKADLSRLTEEIKKAEEILASENIGNYIKESVDALKAALESAKEVANQDLSKDEQSGVDEAVKALQEAINGLQETEPEQPEVDKSALETLYAENKEKDVSGCTESSQEVFKTALVQAEAILSKEDATQDEVDSAVKALQEAIDGLKERADLSSLTALIQTVEETLESEDIGSYTEDSVNGLKTALEAAKEVAAQDLSKDEQTTVEEAVKTLQAALDGLVVETPATDKSLLQALYTENQNRDVSGYTLASQNVFQTAMTNAEAVLGKEDASQEEIETAYNGLKAALAQLKEKADFSSLTELIQKAEEMLASENIGSYTEESVNALKTALESAKEVAAQDLSKDEQSCVDETVKSLQEAIDGLQETEPEQPEVDKSALETLYAENKEKDVSGCTESSQEAFKSALAQAEAILSKEDATQEEVDSAVKALQEAIDGLQENVEDDGNTGNNPSDGNNQSGNTGNNGVSDENQNGNGASNGGSNQNVSSSGNGNGQKGSSTAGTVRTGDTESVIPWVGAGATALVAIVGVILSKRKKF